MTGPGHPGPDPTPSPTGPIRTVRDLIRYARAHGWQHTVWGAWHNKQHVWQAPQWRIEVEVWPEFYTVSLRRRSWMSESVLGAPRVTSVTSAEELAAWLERRGVLPVLEGAQQ